MATRSRVGDPSPMSRSTAAVSASIPLSEEDAATVFGQRTESGTEVEVDSERLPSAVMHLAEYYIAVRSLGSEPPVHASSCSTGLSPETSRTSSGARGSWSRSTTPCWRGWSLPAGQVTNFDLELARLLVPNPELGIPSPRSQLLRLAALSFLFGGEELGLEEILDRIGSDRAAPQGPPRRLCGAGVGLPHLRARPAGKVQAQGRGRWTIGGACSARRCRSPTTYSTPGQATR